MSRGVSGMAVAPGGTVVRSQAEPKEADPRLPHTRTRAHTVPGSSSQIRELPSSP